MREETRKLFHKAERALKAALKILPVAVARRLEKGLPLDQV